MNCGYNYSGCGCNSYTPWNYNPFGCNGYNGYSNWNTIGTGYFGGYNNGVNWFAIVLVIFILLILCGNNRIHG